MKRRSAYLAALLVALLAGLARGAIPDDVKPDRPSGRLILTHYLPWYEAKPSGPRWGWHWTMNVYNPDQMTGGRRKIASHYYPLIGPYDSGDPHVLEYHVLLMKLAGIDGVIIDWYGLQNFRDYSTLHRNTQRLVDQLTRLGMKFAICYEDQTIPALVEAAKIPAATQVRHAVHEIDWMAEHWFPLRNYVRLDDQPVLLSFGGSGLSDPEWKQCLGRLESPVSYFSEHHRRAAAVGAFDWPVPREGLRAVERFRKESRAWPQSIPVAFPRFVDIYAEAKVHDSWGRIEDQEGATFQITLELALATGSAFVQIATWNDWGEGTSVEPSVEFGYRDLEVLQARRRKHIDPHFSPTAEDLRIPRRLLELRRTAESRGSQQLDTVANALASGKLETARSALKELEARR
jgi:hypothetical protein